MARTWVEVVVKPLLAVLFCLLFGVPFVYFGFQTVRVRGEKGAGGTAVFDLTREHLWGLVRREARAEGVTGAAIETGRSGSGTRRRLVSRVVLATGSGSVPLFAGSSNVDDGAKREAVGRINEFLADPAAGSFERTLRVRNVFGWVGLPFLALGVAGLVGWLFSLLRLLGGARAGGGPGAG